MRASAGAAGHGSSCSLWPGPRSSASAARRTLALADSGDAPARIDITRLTVDNDQRWFTMKIKVRNLRQKGRFEFDYWRGAHGADPAPAARSSSSIGWTERLRAGSSPAASRTAIVGSVRAAACPRGGPTSTSSGSQRPTACFPVGRSRHPALRREGGSAPTAGWATRSTDAADPARRSDAAEPSSAAGLGPDPEPDTRWSPTAMRRATNQPITVQPAKKLIAPMTGALALPRVVAIAHGIR